MSDVDGSLEGAARWARTALLAASLGSLLGGCAAWRAADDVPDAGAVGRAETLIARDFTVALGQLDGYSPEATLVRLDRATLDEPFVRAMDRALREAGFAVQNVSGAGGQNLLRYRIERDPASRGSADPEIYRIAIGSVEMRREYGMDEAGRVSPQGLMYVRGADASSVALDESLFEETGRESESALRTESIAGRVAVPDEAPEGAALATRDPSTLPRDEQRPSERMTCRDGSTGGSAQHAPEGGAAKAPRVAGAGEGEFADYTDVEKVVLEFEYQSLRFDEEKLSRLAALVERFDAATDRVSVVGYSFGNVAGGTEALALERAARAREALSSSGVPLDRVVARGCWGERGSEPSLPGRATVVTLERRGRES